MDGGAIGAALSGGGMVSTAAVATACPYCGVGCGVLAAPDGRGGATVAGDPDHPANRGRLCAKGAALGETLSLEERILHPEIGGRRVGWDAALDLVADRFSAAIRDHGPDSVAFYVSGQLLTEDYYVANKLMKGFIGSANIDTNSRLCMASAVAGHRRAFGTDTVPGVYEDLELADLVVLVGSNLAWCHPVLFQRIEAARAARPAMRVVVVDPRETATVGLADSHLALRPGSDVALFGGLLRWLDRAGLLTADAAGLDAARAAVAPLDPAAVAAATGLADTEVAAFYALWAGTPRVVTVWSQGVNQAADATDRVAAILNAHIATGRIGTPGAGPFSVTGQPNAMGGREVGGLANMLAAHLDIESPDHRARVRAFWNAPTIAERPGLKAVDLFRAVGEGRIKALWIMATNPAVSLPDADGVARALAGCPFVVVSDVSRAAEAARAAHVLLPALAWGEKDGTVTNSDRTISRQRAFLPQPGQARADWRIVSDVAARMGWAEAFAYDGPAAIFREHAALSGAAGRDFDISACADLSDSDYDALRPFRWPLPRTGGGGDRFFADGRFFTPDGRARLHPTPWTPPAARPGLTLNTGRTRDQWHTMTRTGLAPRLSAHAAEPFIEIHPADAARLGVGPADLVEVSGPEGQAVLRALVTRRTPQGAIFAPMHWTSATAPTGRVGAAIPAVCDPVSGQPALKSATVVARRYPARWHGLILSRARPDLAGCDYWALARRGGGWSAEVAGETPPADALAFARRALAAPEGAEPLAVLDAAKGLARVAFLDAAGRLAGAVFIGPGPVAASRAWLAAALDDPAPDRAAVLAGRAGAGAGADPGPTVCACFQVGVNAIARAVAEQGLADVAAVGRALSAGSNCGACRPEIARIIATARRESAA
jgi:assimilatory nitrate reductase catalytic subunit